MLYHRQQWPVITQAGRRKLCSSPSVSDRPSMDLLVIAHPNGAMTCNRLNYKPTRDRDHNGHNTQCKIHRNDMPDQIQRTGGISHLI